MAIQTLGHRSRTELPLERLQSAYPAAALWTLPPEGLGFEDMEAAFNMRDWLQKAREEKGAKMVGGGFGFGQADIDIELEGCRYNVSIRPLKR
jgi:hypothetical protein